MDPILEQIRKVGTKIDVPIAHRLLKAMEELGELSQAVLNASNSANSSATSSDPLEESVDLWIVATDLLLKLHDGFPAGMIARKLAKWNSKA